MSADLVIVSTASPETRLLIRSTPGEELDVDLKVRGMSASTHIDGRRSSTTGWEHPEPGVVLDSTQRGLVELLDFLADHASGWSDEERWQSRDGRLQLGFSNLGGGEVLMSVVLKQYVPDGWVAYAKLRLAAGGLAAIGAAARELLAIETG
jgi:uncharacterized protein DUF6228